MVFNAFVLISLKSKNRYRNIICIVKEELLSETDQFIQNNIGKFYEDYTNYIFISFIQEKIAIELLKKSNYKKLDLSNITIENNVTSYGYAKLIKKSQDEYNEEKEKYYKRKYFEEILTDFNKDIDYKVSIDNLSISDISDNNMISYSYCFNIIYSKDTIKKVFDVDGWIQYDCDNTSECNYDDEIYKYIEDYKDIIDLIQENLEEYEKLF